MQPPRQGFRTDLFTLSRSIHSGTPTFNRKPGPVSSADGTLCAEAPCYPRMYEFELWALTLGLLALLAATLTVLTVSQTVQPPDWISPQPRGCQV